MKKIVFSLVAIFCATFAVAQTATVLYEWAEGDTEVAINWDLHNESNITAAQLPTAKVGDYIQITVVENGTSNYPSATISSKATWKELLGVASFSMTKESSETYVARFCLTKAGLAQLQTNDIYVNGAGFNLKKIEHIAMNSETDYSNTIWFGNLVCSWNGIQLHEGNFAAAQLDYTLRVHYTDLGKNAQLAILNSYEQIGDTKYQAASGEYLDYIIDENVLTAMQGGKFRISGYNLTLTQVELIAPVVEEDTYITTRTTMWEGEQMMSWAQLCSMDSYIPQIVEGDSIYVTVASIDQTISQWPQVRVTWKTGYVNYACYKDTEFPRTYALHVADTMVTQMNESGKLYLSGTAATVTKVVLVHRQKVSAERGNAVTTIWSGSQSINWSGSNEWLRLESSAFAAAKAGMRLRMNFSNMQLGAQGRIVDGTSWGAIEGADSYEKLPTAWGDYYEFTLTEAMATTLQEKGLVVSGVGYTLTSVQLIDPTREYIISTTFDHADIRAWEPADGTPNLSVTFTNYEDIAVNTTIDVTLMTDMFKDYQTYSQPVELSAGETKTVSIEFTDLQPGFYRMAAKANNNNICTYYIGYNPTAIVSPADSEADFLSFWNNWKTKLAAIPVNASLAEHDATNAAYTVYVASMQSVSDEVDGEPITIKSYYRQSNTPGKRPCLVRFQGTDGGTSTLKEPTWVAPDDWCELIVSTRGQMLNRDNKYNFDFYSYGLGDNDLHYYRAAYLDCVRAIDFLKTRTEIDTRNIFAAGGSQGGTFTYVTAALCEGDIRAIAPSITGHADFVHTMEIVGWPTNVFNNWINAAVEAGTYATYEEGKAALLRHQSYFDTKNFAPYITCPVTTNFSLQDQTDGPHLNIAPYNLLTQVAAEDKTYSINPFNGHAAASDWNTTYMNFFNSYLVTEPQTVVITDNTDLATLPNGTICDVTLTREMVVGNGIWNTIALPFAMNAEQIASAFGEGTKVAELISQSTVASLGEINLLFAYVDAIEAGTPYIILPANSANAVEIEDVTISTEPHPVVVPGQVTMHPVLQTISYNYTDGDPIKFFLAEDQYLHYNETSNQIKGLRAYFTFDNVTSVAQASHTRARIVFSGDTTTDTENLLLTNTNYKRIENGQLIIIRDGVKFNAQGQKL